MCRLQISDPQMERVIPERVCVVCILFESGLPSTESRSLFIHEVYYFTATHRTIARDFKL